MRTRKYLLQSVSAFLLVLGATQSGAAQGTNLPLITLLSPNPNTPALTWIYAGPGGTMTVLGTIGTLPTGTTLEKIEILINENVPPYLQRYSNTFNNTTTGLFNSNFAVPQVNPGEQIHCTVSVYLLGTYKKNGELKTGRIPNGIATAQIVLSYPPPPNPR